MVVLPPILWGLPTLSTHPAFTLNQLFHNPNTRTILQAMASADAPLPRGVVNFLVAFANAHPDTADLLIEWMPPAPPIPMMVPTYT
jgi:hypothetical protein